MLRQSQDSTERCMYYLIEISFPFILCFFFLAGEKTRERLIKEALKSKK